MLVMIAKNFSLSVYLLICFFGIATCSDCTYIHGEYAYHDEEYVGYHAICTGVTSDFLLDPPPPNPSEVFILYVEGNSTIPHLQETSTFSSLSSLRYVTLKKLSMESISPRAFRGLTALVDVNLNINRIREIPVGAFNDLANLEKLFLSRNEITRIPFGVFDHLVELKYLDLSKNRINQIDVGAFSDLVSLETLDLDDNQLNILPGSLFQNLRSLERLFVSNNPISYWQEVGFRDNVSIVIASNTSMRYFIPNLRHAVINRLYLNNGSLEEFDFSRIGLVNDLIDLQNNRITTLRNFGSVDAYLINLNHNNLREVSEIPPNVIGLLLAHNQITRIERIPDPRNYRLQYLDLSHNNLVYGSCLGLPDLRVLNLRSNRISALDANSFQGCNNLREILLSSNDIYDIQRNTFSGLTSLEVLDLSGNNLRTFNFESLNGLTSLNQLSLDNNQISNLNVDELALNAPGLKNLRLAGNPFPCTQIQSLLSSLDRRYIQVRDEVSLRSKICDPNAISDDICY